MAKRPKPSSSAPRAARAADATVSVAGAILRVLGTILLIVLVTGLLFLCIFAYYVKNCLSTDLDVQLSDFTVSLSSSILYEDSDGNWQNLTNLSSTENRVWIDYADIPKDMEHAAVTLPQIEEIERLRDEKYRTREWTWGRNPGYRQDKYRKYPFGGVQILMETKGGNISEIRILGDFFGTCDIEELESRLTGLPTEEDAILDALREFDPGRCIAGMTAEELAEQLLA